MCLKSHDGFWRGLKDSWAMKRRETRSTPALKQSRSKNGCISHCPPFKHQINGAWRVASDPLLTFETGDFESAAWRCQEEQLFFFVLRLTQPSFLLSLMFEGDSVMSMWGLYKQEADNQFHSVDGGKPAVLQVGWTFTHKDVIGGDLRQLHSLGKIWQNLY